MADKMAEFIDKMKRHFPDDDYSFEDGRFCSTFIQIMWEAANGR